MLLLIQKTYCTSFKSFYKSCQSKYQILYDCFKKYKNNCDIRSVQIERALDHNGNACSLLEAKNQRMRKRSTQTKSNVKGKTP